MKTSTARQSQLSSLKFELEEGGPMVIHSHICSRVNEVNCKEDDP